MEATEVSVFLWGLCVWACAGDTALCLQSWRRLSEDGRGGPSGSVPRQEGARAFLLGRRQAQVQTGPRGVAGPQLQRRSVRSGSAHLPGPLATLPPAEACPLHLRVALCLEVGP